MSDFTPLFDAEQVAAEWTERICGRLAEMNVSQAELDETRNVIFNFTRIAGNEMSKNRLVKLPHTDVEFQLEAGHALQVIDLFLRGVNQTAKKLRDAGLDWEERRVHLENIGWKIFHLSRVLVGCMHSPDPASGQVLKSDKDVQLVMKQSVEILYRENVNGVKSLDMSFLHKWRP